jgi:hypothetical protein
VMGSTVESLTAGFERERGEMGMQAHWCSLEGRRGGGAHGCWW